MSVTRAHPRPHHCVTVLLCTCCDPLLLQVVSVRGETATIQLSQPVCTRENEKVALSRRVDRHLRYVPRLWRERVWCMCVIRCGVP
ncbi:MAG: hypothetical protein EOO65_03975 [Methanosarcinales archaeon]|nr:MAG: hypothetical protein EOO65_03975 [Methanosarcinales archaeon]